MGLLTGPLCSNQKIDEEARPHCIGVKGDWDFQSQTHFRLPRGERRCHACAYSGGLPRS